jgi:hypothetical protein
MQALGCFSAGAVEDDPETEADAGNDFDQLYCDVGGEG